MDGFIEEEKKKGKSTIFIVAGLIALLVVIAIAFSVSRLPSPEQEKEAVLEGAVREGSPEFAQYTKNIIISNKPDGLIEKFTGLGDVIMEINGSIHNRGDKTINGLEVSVGMIDTKNKLIKDRKILVIPEKFPELKPGETIDVKVEVPGFSDGDDRANAIWNVTAIKFK